MLNKFTQFHFYLNNLCEIFSIQIIIRFQEDLTKSRLADRIIFCIKFIETMKRITILTKWIQRKLVQQHSKGGGSRLVEHSYRMHIQHIHRQIVCC